MIKSREDIERIAALISSDAQSDAMTIDGSQFNGAVIGMHLGNIYASLQGLAECVKLLASNNQEENNDQN